MTKGNKILCIIIIGLLFLLFFEKRGNRKEVRQINDQWQAITDKIRYSADSSISVIRVAYGNEKQIVKKLRIKGDSLSNALADAIRKGRGNTVTATVIEERTVIKHDTIPYEIIRLDTVMINKIAHVIPSLSANFKDEWISYKAVFDTSGFSLDLTTFNTLTLTHKKKRGNISLIVENKSPYTLITDQKSYVFKNDIKGFFDCGVYSAYTNTLVNGFVSGGGYVWLKYKNITAEASAGLMYTGLNISPVIEGGLRYTVFGFKY